MNTNPKPTGVDDRQITSNPVVDQKQGFVNIKPTGGYINKLRKDWEAILQKDAEMVRRVEPTGDYGELMARAEAAVRLLANTQMSLSLSDWSHMANDLLAPLTAIRTLLAKVEQLERGS